MGAAKKRFRGSARDARWLAAFTGYCANYAASLLRSHGLDWHRASVSQIRRVINAQADRARRARQARAKFIVVGGRRVSVRAFAERVGVSSVTILRRRRVLGSWRAVIELSLATAGQRRIGKSTGRPAALIEIDGETRTPAEWRAMLGVSHTAVHRGARKHGRTVHEELIDRVKTRRSDAAHAPASVASDPTLRMVRGDRSVSACAASGRGAANDNEQRGAA